MKNIYHITAISWLILVILMITYLFTVTIDQITVETNILKLLPTEDRDPLLESTIERFSERISNRLVFLVSGKDEKTTAFAARDLVKQLSQTGYFDLIQGAIPEDQQKQIAQSIFPYRYALLSREITDILNRPAPIEALIQRLQRILYSPASLMVGSMLAEDPLLIFYSWMKELGASAGKTSLIEGFIGFQSENKVELLLFAKTKVDPFATGVQTQITDTLKNLFSDIQNKHQGVKIVYTGILPFAQRAASEAQKEMSFVGGISMLGVVLLIWISFRSLRQLVIGIIPIGIGILFSIVVSVAISPTMHLITMVFGASMIGICIDYSFHYFSVHQTINTKQNQKSTLQLIFPGISLGLLTSLLGYLGFFFTPFPGLQQIALFSATGLVTAYLTVVFWFPLLMKKTVAKKRPPILFYFSQFFLKTWLQKSRIFKIRIFILSLLPLLGIMLSLTMVVDDDIKRLQHQPQDLLAIDKHIHSLTGDFDISRFILVHAGTTDQLLKIQRQVLKQLNAFKINKQLLGYKALATLLPDVVEQRENQQQLLNLILENSSVLENAFSNLGYSNVTIEQIKNELRQNRSLTLDQWLNSPLGKLESDLWIGNINGQFVSLILLRGITDEHSLIELNDQNGVKYVNKIKEYSDLMGRYREQATWMICGAYLLIFILLIYRYGIKNALFVIGAPAFATLSTLLIFSLLQIPINLLHILSMLLVLGISIDYSIFMMESETHADATMMAILLSGLTTILSFGVLSISNMPAIRDVGVFISIGIFTAIWISPMALNISNVTKNSQIYQKQAKPKHLRRGPS